MPVAKTTLETSLQGPRYLLKGNKTRCMNISKKRVYIEKLTAEIVNLKKLQIILRKKDPPHEQLNPALGNALIGMVNSLLYISGKHEGLPGFNESFFYNLQATMHITFFSDLHIGTEECLIAILRKQKIEPELNRRKQVESIIQALIIKVGDAASIEREVSDIRNLVSKNPTFNDHLNTVLENCNGLSDTYKRDSRKYFNALNVIRNKVSHPQTALTDSEKNTLREGAFSNAIGVDGKLQMTFERYFTVLMNVVRFLDIISTNIHQGGKNSTPLPPRFCYH